MARGGLVAVCVLVVCLELVARAQHECLDQISLGRRCCTPSAFTKLSFKLRLNSVANECDSPSYLDEGVRLEVRRPGQNWQPIRFYTATEESRTSSLVNVVSGGAHVTDENNALFPVLQTQSNGPFTVSEYLCGAEYNTPGTEYRWLQRYNSSAVEGKETWALGDVSITYQEHGIRCSAHLTKYDFRNENGSRLDNSSWTPPTCEQDPPQPGTVYLNGGSESDEFAQRSVLLTPIWWNANCSRRAAPGCDLNEECSGGDISNEICSVGNVLQCQCEYSQIAGDDNTCFDASVGFEWTFYDVSEHEAAKVCVGVLNGTLFDDVSMQIISYGGTAETDRDFTPVRDSSMTLTPTKPRSCVTVTISDDTLPEDTECLAVSLTVGGQQNSNAQLSQDKATICIIDNDVVTMLMDSNTVQEGQNLAITLKNPASQTQVRPLRKTLAGTAINGADYTGINNAITLAAGQSLPMSISAHADDVWEGYEVFYISVTVFSVDPIRHFNRTLFIEDINELHVGFDEMDYMVNENDGSVTVCVTIEQGNIGDSAKLSLGVSTQIFPGSAQEILDYRRNASVISFTSSRSECLEVAIVDDTGVEGNEFLMLSLTLLQGTPNVFFTHQNVTINIIDDDVLEIGFVSSEYTVHENATFVIVCIEVKEGSLSVPVNLSISIQSEDQSSLTNGKLSAILTEHESCIRVGFEDDLVYEETEVLTVVLSLTGQLNNAVNVSQDTTKVFITDDDALVVGFRMDNTVPEDVGSVNVCVEVLSGELGMDIALKITSNDGTAKDEMDYVSLSMANVALDSAHSMSCLSISIMNDLIYEDTEFFTISLSDMDPKRSALTLSPDTYTISITNDDGLDIGFVQSVYTTSELSTSVDVCVDVKEGSLGAVIKVAMSIEGLSAEASIDFRASTSEILTLEPPLNVPFCVTAVEVIDDMAFEVDEVLTVSLTATDGLSRVILSQPTATIIITDEDAVTIGIDHSDYIVREDVGALRVCVAVHSGRLGTNLTLNIGSEAGTAKENVDYDKLSMDFTLSPTDSTECFFLGIFNDTALEENESMTLSLSLVEVQERVQIIPRSSNVLILDNDEVLVGFEQDNYTILESGPQVKVCVRVLSGELRIDITLQLHTQAGTARGSVDYQRLSETVTFSGNVTKQCVSIDVVNDNAVELSESMTVYLSLVGMQERVRISPQNVTVFITDDDVAVIGLDKIVAPDAIDTFRLVHICAVTNNTLERSFNLTVITSLTMDSATQPNVHHRHTLELQPNATRVCISFNITVEQELSFSVMSDEDAIQIPDPNGTIVGEPSFDDILLLLSSSDVNLQDVVDALDGIVDTLIENGQTASYKFSNTFMSVVSTVLDITNGKSQKTEDEANEDTGNDANPGTSLLETLDKFALQSFNTSVGPIESNNTRIEVQNLHEAVEEGMRLTGISGPEEEKIELLTEVLEKFNFSVTIGSYYLRNVTGLLPGSIPNISNSELVSSVLSSALWCGNRRCERLTDEPELVRISLHHRPAKGSEEPICVFYDLQRFEWFEDGCNVSNESNSTLTVCSCNHLTHFAVMLSPKNSVDEQNAYNLRLIGYVGISISLVCLFIIIVIFSSFKSLWSMRNYIHINLCISLFVTQLLFVVGVDKTQNQIACQTIAVLLHYGFLVTFMWMLMEGVVLYVALVRVFVTKPHRYIIGFTVFSYGAPLVYMAIIVPLGFLLPHAPHYGGKACWLKYDTHFIWALISPVILVIVTNVGFFVMAIYIIWKQQTRKKLSIEQIHKAKHWLKVSVSLLVVMGISWIIGVITFHEALLFVSYIFTIVVAFQGAMMFIMFVVLSKQVRLALKKCLVRNVIMKSEFLSDRFSEFTRSTQAGYSQSHSSVSTKSNTISQGIQLGAFLALPAKPSVVAEVQKEYEANISPSPPHTVSPSPSPAPSTPYASSCNSPIPSQREGPDVHSMDGDDGPPNSFTVIFVTSDRDSGRGSPDTDTICTPPPDNSPALNSLSVSELPATN